MRCILIRIRRLNPTNAEQGVLITDSSPIKLLPTRNKMRKMSSGPAVDHVDAANRPYVKPSALLHTSLVSSSFDFGDDPRPIFEGLRHAHSAVKEDRGASGEDTCIDDVEAVSVHRVPNHLL